MKKIAPLFLIGIAAVVIVAALQQSSPNSDNDTSNGDISPLADRQEDTVIMMRDDGYSPSRVTIKRNQTVTFTNAGSEDRWPASNIHPTHEIYSSFDSKHPVLPGQSWAFPFDRVGTWYFHDHLAPGITGSIVVQ